MTYLNYIKSLNCAICRAKAKPYKIGEYYIPLCTVAHRGYSVSHTEMANECKSLVDNVYLPIAKKIKKEFECTVK